MMEDVMTRLAIVAVAAAAAISVSAPAYSAGKCIKAGGWGTGVTEDLAKFMAEAALKNSAKAWGGDAVKVDKVAQACKFEFPAFQCNASAKACK
jgi:hypothetical protein